MANDLCGPFDENIIPNTTSRAYLAVVGLTCKEGFTLKGKDVVTCDITGWSSRPLCVRDDGSSDQLLIIVICAVASAVALGVLIFAMYMLLANCRKEQKAKIQKKAIMDTLRELNTYHAVTQDCVGMPAVVYDNINSTLRGRTSVSDQSSNPASPQTMTGSETDLTTEKAFIY